MLTILLIGVEIGLLWSRPWDTKSDLWAVASAISLVVAAILIIVGIGKHIESGFFAKVDAFIWKWL